MVIHPSHTVPSQPPPVWKIATAFAIVYLGYGLNFLAIKAAVETLPAFLFAASHILGAGLLLMAWTALRGEKILLPPAAMARAATAALFLFVGGVGLVTQGEKLGVPSGVAAIIKASVPLWVAVIEALRPRGEKPGALAIVGLLIGAGGVAALVLPRLATNSESTLSTGIWLLLLSALLFAIGSIFIRHNPPSTHTTKGVFWMMLFGGTYLALLGTAFGEFSQITAADFAPPALAAFAFLLFVHSLAAFTAMNWLLKHLPAPLVTTKFFVSPAIAVVAGWFVLGEPIGTATLASLALILVGVAIVFRSPKTSPKEEDLTADQ